MAGNLTAMIASIFSGGVTADPYYEYTTLLLPGNGTNGAQNNTFLDGSTNNFTITRNGNTTQGTFSPFSQTGWGGAFNTSTTYLTVTDTANLRFGSSNFTIEAWVYRSASGATQTIASKGAATPTGWVFQISSADKLVFTDTSTSITGATSIAANTWTYVAVVRAGTGSNQTTLYVNGTSDGTGTSATNFNQTSNMLIGADRSSTNFANGYISNLRLSNTNRTISSTPTTALTADANTIFLSLNINRFQYTDSTAAFTNIAVTGTPSVVAFSPFNPTASWSAATYGGSGYFDVSGDYLTLPVNSAFDLGTNACCVEAWVYLTSSTNLYLYGTTNFAGGTTRANFLVAPNRIYLEYPGTVIFDGTSVTLSQNSWNHVCWTRASTSGPWRGFINGVLAAYATNTASLLQTGAAQQINGFNSGNTAPGYVADFRVVNGSVPTNYQTSSTTVGTSIFTPPTAPLTAITNTSLLLNFTNAGIYDATSKNDLETVGNAQISNAVTPQFGSTSIKFNGTTDYLTSVASTLTNIGSGDFTIETWFRTASVSTQQAIVNIWGSTPTQFQLEISSSGKLQFAWAPYSTSVYAITGATTLSANTWYYVAIVRSGSAFTLYLNGSSDGTLTSSATTTNNATVFIGANNSSSVSRYFNGYMQDVRITRYARTITASPTAAFPTL